MKRTHMCGELRPGHTGQEVTVCGWVHTRRDHGGVIFIDLRDRTGLAQVVFNPTASSEAHRRAHDVRGEYVLACRGEVKARPADAVNPNLATGEIELWVNEVEVLSESHTPPFEIQDGVGVDEAVRLRYRYLDLRRPEMQEVMLLRAKVTRAVRELPGRRGFHRHRDAGAGQEHPRGGARLRGPLAPAVRPLLRPAPVAPAVQATPDGGRLRPLLPDRQVLPRRGLEGRPPARVHPDRPGDVLRHFRRRHRLHGGDVRPPLPGGQGRGAGPAHRAHHLAAIHGAVRRRPPRPPLRHAHHRPHLHLRLERAPALPAGAGRRASSSAASRWKGPRRLPARSWTSWSTTPRAWAPPASSGWSGRKAETCARPWPSTSPMKRSRPCPRPWAWRRGT